MEKLKENAFSHQCEYMPSQPYRVVDKSFVRVLQQPQGPFRLRRNARSRRTLFPSFHRADVRVLDGRAVPPWR